MNSPAPPLGIGGNPYSVTTTKKVPTIKSETKYLIDRNILNDYGIPDDKIVIQQDVTNSIGNGVVYGEPVVNTLLSTLPSISTTEHLMGFKDSIAYGNKDLVLVDKDVINQAGIVIPGPIPDLELIGFAVIGIVLVAAAIANEIINSEVNLTISTFPQDEGLAIGDEGFVLRPSQAPETELYTDRNGTKDYNYNRVFTLTWKLTDYANNEGLWYIGGQLLSPDELPGNQIALDVLNLTAGQKYYWQGEYVSANTGDRGRFQGGEFIVPQHQPKTNPFKTFSSVTVITPDSNNSAGDLAGVQKSLEIAKGIARNFENERDNGTILVYNPTTSTWTAPLTEFAAPTNFVPNAFGTPLVVVVDWGETSALQSSGFAEAAADSLFAALVNLNQSYLDEKKDALFDSSFHFIGHGRGTVVNSEVIQRLGTFYPENRYPQMFPDVQMTTLDLHDFGQNGVNYFDPQVQVWDNVSFADNYYQTNSTSLNRGEQLINIIPPGWSGSNLPVISRADLNVDLSSRAGFTQEDLANQKSPHNNTLAWYAGTANLNLDGLSSAFTTPIFRRKGDFSQDVFYDGSTYQPWYTNDFQKVDPTSTTLVPVPFGDPNAQWEGVGTGWYYSRLGGGYARSTQFPNNTPATPVEFDNTAMSGQRGDYAVPTLFNGNFDINTAWRKPTDPIPGWVFENNSNLGQNRLKLWSNSDVLPADSPDRTTYSTTIDNNYAIELHNGDSLVHNPFVLTDWGSLRFNILVPTLNNVGTLNVKIQESGTNNWIPLAATQIQRSEDPLIIDPISGNLIANPARPNNVGYYDFNGVSYEDPYTHTISYGERGFETFVLDIPEYLRGKSVVLKFTSTSTSTIYLDDVFFKSQHLLLGNPTDARPDETANSNNYLIERPQYSLSYNNTTKTANWVSWEVNKSWLGTASRPNVSTASKVGYPPDGYPINGYIPDAPAYPWHSSSQLPSSFTKIEGSDYSYNARGLQRGHLTPVIDRDRTSKDIYATFLTENLLPQHADSNTKVWKYLEQNLNKFVEDPNSDNRTYRPTKFYVIAGGLGYEGDTTRRSNGTTTGGFERAIGNLISYDNGQPYLDKDNGTWTQNPKQILASDYTWKIIVGLEANQTLSDINATTDVTTVLIPNCYEVPSLSDWILPNGREVHTENLAEWHDWRKWQISVRELEQMTNYNFLSNVPQYIQDIIEDSDVSELSTSPVPVVPIASLLVDDD